MAIFLFRNGDNPVEYCATDSRSGHRLPPETTARWLYHTELQNALHAATFGLKDFEVTVRSIARQGYVRYTENRLLRA
jgi:hypothetical protein